MPEYGNGLDELAQQVEAALRLRGCKERGDELLIRCLCPGHNDQNPSAAYNIVKRCWICHGCGADGGLVTGVYPLAPLLDIELSNNGSRSSTHRAPPPQASHSTTPVPQPQAVSTTEPRVAKETQWDLPDHDGLRTFVFHRQDFDHGPKRCWWTTTDTKTGQSALGTGGRKPKSLPLYGWQDLGERTAGDDSPLILTEGAKCCDLIRSLGLRSLATMTGANVVPGSAALKILEGEHVVFCRDNDGSGLKHSEGTALAAADIASRAMVFLPPGLTGRGDDIEQWIDARKAEGKDTDQIRHELLLAIEEQSYNPVDETSVKPSQGKGPVSSTLTYKPFPTELFPKPVQHFVREVSASIGVDEAMVSVQVLAVMAGCVGTKRRVRLKHGYSEWGAIWSAVVARSGTLKSPTFKAVTGQAWSWEAETIEAHRQAVKQYDDDLQAWKDRPTDRRGLKPEPPDPVERRVVSDVTVESLCLLLRDAPAGLLLARNELAGWLRGFDQYKSGKGADVQSWLEMWDGGTVVIDRKGSRGTGETISISPALVSVTGTVQPGVVSRALGQEHFENGLAARLLMAMPPEQPTVWNDDDQIHPATERAWARLLRSLRELEFDEFGKPIDLTLSKEAKPVWVEWVNGIGQRIHEETGPLHAALSKLKGYAARIALDIELATNPKSTEVGEAAMRSGVGIAQWFEHEDERVYDVLTEDEEQAERRELVEWVERQGGWASKNDLRRKVRKYWPECPRDAQKALDDLEAHKLGEWHTRLPVTGRPSGGPQTYDFVLNGYIEEYQEWLEKR